MRYSSNGLGFFLESGTLYLFDPKSGKRAKTTPGVTSIVALFALPTSVPDALVKVPETDRAATSEIADFLVKHGFLREHDDTTDATSTPGWTAVGHHAQAFHAASWDANFIPFRSERSAELTDDLSAHDAPARFKSYPDAPRYYLPRFPRRLDMRTDDALLARRTHRDFSARSVTLNDFATIMQYTFGFSGLQDTGAFGAQFVKTSPAGGSRHDVEAYALAFRVNDIEPALYHYNVLVVLD